MSQIEVRPGLDVAYEDHWFGAPWTTPETVVMVHGNAESTRAWDRWVPFLAGRYRVVRLDMPGFGASPAPAEFGWTVTELAASIGQFLDAMKITRCHLIGAKYGGSACMQLASEQPDRLQSLMLFGSPIRGSGSGPADAQRARGLHAWASESMRARLGSSASEAQIRWWADELMGKSNPKAVLAASESRIGMELDDNLSSITTPTLIVTTQESGLQSVEAVERYAERFPNARVVVLPGDSYHISAVEPEACARHALAFMAEVSAATAPAHRRAAE